MAAPPKSEPRKASFEVNTLPEPVGPLRRRSSPTSTRITRLSTGATRRRCTSSTDGSRRCWTSSTGPRAGRQTTPSGFRRKLGRGGLSARGEYEKALDLELAGWKHAEAELDRPETRLATARRKSISASNIADELRRLGRTTEALEWGRLSVELWPSNSINHLVLAMAVYRAGYHDEADRIIEQLRRMADFLSGRDVLALCLSYERELHEMDGLPSVQRLAKDMAGARIDHRTFR